MSTNFFEELTGKVCEITLREDEVEEGVLQAVDGDWLKLHDETGERTVYLNANQIISISVEDEKDDRESRRNRHKWL